MKRENKGGQACEKGKGGERPSLILPWDEQSRIESGEGDPFLGGVWAFSSAS